MTNVQEFKTGTDPRVATNRFTISTTNRLRDVPRIGFQSISGKTCRLEYRDDLLTGNRDTLIDAIYGTGGLLQITDPSAVG
jgi:hypothetical protein